MAETRMPSSWTLHLQTANDYGVWTGGANPKEMDSLKTTSFTGGLRFWTDALLRAEGKGMLHRTKPLQLRRRRKTRMPDLRHFRLHWAFPGFHGPHRNA